MKQLFLVLLLVVALPIAAQTYDCKVPTSLILHYDYHSFSKYQGDNYIERKNRKVLDDRGFSTDMRNTKMALCFRYISGARSIEGRVSLVDTENNQLLYSLKLDTCYIGDNVDRLLDLMIMDLTDGLNPQFNDALETIRQMIISIWDESASSTLKTAKKYISDGDPQMAMFLLAQVPSCCKCYPRMRSFIAAAFREYVKGDQTILLSQAKKAWKIQESEADARFVVALLNSEMLDKSNQKKADKILKDVQKKYPTIDITAHEDYTATPELTAVAAKMAYSIGVEYGSLHVPITIIDIPGI